MMDLFLFLFEGSQTLLWIHFYLLKGHRITQNKVKFLTTDLFSWIYLLNRDLLQLRAGQERRLLSSGYVSTPVYSCPVQCVAGTATTEEMKLEVKINIAYAIENLKNG